METNFIDTEANYGYKSGETGFNYKCLQDSTNPTNIEVSSYANITPSNVAAFKAAIQQQPVAVAVQANMPCWQFYHEGVLDNVNCGTNLDHAVLAVGYGNDNGQDYWLVKNSWNTSWGDQGYIRLAVVEGDGICGVQMDPLTVQVTA